MMSSTTHKIAPSEWEHHKDTIVGLYRRKPLKDVRADMHNQHGFDASRWQYEMQLKRWDIRKNATRREWQQYFSTNRDRSIPSSLHAPIRNSAPVILNKSTASKKRASRWVTEIIVEPNDKQASASTPGNEAQPQSAQDSNESIAASKNTRPADQKSLPENTDTFCAIESVSEPNGPCLSNDFATHSVLESPLRTLIDTPNGHAPSPDFNFTFSIDLQSPVYDQSNFEFAGVSIIDPPARSNMNVFMLQNIKQNLPFAQLEQSLRSSGIALEIAAGQTIFGGFALKIVDSILSSENQSMMRQIPNSQQFLHRLGSQIPGESSVLVANDQAFEAKFIRILLFSMLNGLSSLDDVPMKNILRFLNRFVVDTLLLDILEQCPRHVCRTLADSILRAAIEEINIKTVELLLTRGLVDVNETVCHHSTGSYTPIERAAALRSPKLIKLFIDAGADVNKSYTRFRRANRGGALSSLIKGIQDHLQADDRSTIPPESFEAFNILVDAGARVHPELMMLHLHRRAVELNFLICQNVFPGSHRALFKGLRFLKPKQWPLKILAMELDDCHATILVRSVISLCHQADCNKCLVNSGEFLTDTVMHAALAGQLELVRLLLQESDLSPKLPRILIAAIQSRNSTLIDFILGHGPNLDPPAIVDRSGELHRLVTPISEAVRSGNEDLKQKLEAEGCLDHLAEGGRFEALINGAAEAGDVACMRMLLARAVTSKQAYREAGTALQLALHGGHLDIAYMLLEAGATSNAGDLRMWTLSEEMGQKAIQMLHALVASEACAHGTPALFFVQADQSINLDMIHEYPDVDLVEDIEYILVDCIREDRTAFLKDLLPTLRLKQETLDKCLVTAVSLGHVDLVGHFLDMGANPFTGPVLQAVIPERTDLLRLLFQKDRQRQIIPECIGVHVLEAVMGDSAVNSEALDELIKTKAVNFVRLENLYDPYQYDGPEDLLMSFTPLGLAIQGIPGGCDTNMVATKKFLEAGADPNGICKYNPYWTEGSPLMTALMVAIETGREDAVDMLLDYGADVNARPRLRTTRTALQYAAELGNADIVRLFLRRGRADVNSSAALRGGATALQFAAMSGNCNMVADLLDHGAQLGAHPSKVDGMWPLEGAAANGRLDMIRYLWELKDRAVAKWEFPKGFSERECLRAMNFARENGHIGCRDLISDLSGVSVDRLETDEYGAPWIAYTD